MPLWEDVRPVLVTAYEIMRDTPAGYIDDGQQLADRFGRQNGDRAWISDIRTLTDAGYLEAYFSADGPRLIQGTPAGRQEVEGWPGPRTETGAGELLLSLLENAADDAGLPETQRQKARGLAAAAREAGTDLIAKVAVEFACRASGLGQ